MQQLETAVQMLKSNKTGSLKLNSREIIVTTLNAIVLRSTDDRTREKGNFSELILAARVNGAIIGNSDRLRTKENRDITQDIQRPLSDLIPMIPFGAIRQAGLSLKDFVEVDKGTEKTVPESVSIHVGEAYERIQKAKGK